MGEKKSKFGCFFKVLIIFLIIIGLLVGGSYLFYFFTKEDVNQYVPFNYTGYIKVDSISDAYNKLIDLRAADVILAQPKLKKAYKALLDFRTSPFAKNKAVASLLNMKVHMILHQDYSMVFLVDLGFKSMLIRPAQFSTDYIGKMLGEKTDYTLESLKRDNYTIHKLMVNNQVFYFSICKNLLFFSFDADDIDNLYYTKDTGNNIYSDPGFQKIKNRVRAGSIADAYFNTEQMIEPFIKGIPEVDKIVNKIKFDSNTSVSFDISNENIFLSTYTNCSSEDEKINKFLSSDVNKLGVLKYLPVDTNLCSAVSFESFKELYNLAFYLQEGKYDDIVKLAKRGSKLVFDMELEEMLFSWIGNELGVFTSDVASDPVIFIQIKNNERLNFVKKTLLESPVLKKSKDILYDDVLINKIAFPEFLIKLVKHFAKIYIDAPYYVIVDDYIFFSMNAKPLSSMVRKYNHKLTLANDVLYKSLADQVAGKSNIYIYFNNAEKTPDFFKGNDMVGSLFTLYEKGALTINLNNSNLKIDLAAVGVNIKKTKNYPGYPKKIMKMITSPVMCENIAGSGLDEMIYINESKQFMAVDVNNNAVPGFFATLDGDCSHEPIYVDLDKDGQKEFYLFSEKGILHKFNSSGKKVEPYPIETEFKGSFIPVVYKENLIFYSKSKKKLFYMKGEEVTEFAFEFEKPLLSAPSVYGDYLAFYPKSADGTIYVVNAQSGETVTGWPQNAGGIGFGSPVIGNLAKVDGKKIIFITQNGNLNVWNFNGNQDVNFPKKIEGVYYSQPVIGNVTGGIDNQMILLDKDGWVKIVSHKGEVLREKQIKEAGGGKDRKITLFDADRNGKKEIYIYGGKNTIIALDEKLITLTGFPVKGNTKPSFTDFNSDGQYEMVVGGIDSYLYVYTIPR